MYKSIVQWRDLEDGHLYNAGDPFPCDGREISPERITALTTGRNKAGFALIEEVVFKAENRTNKADEISSEEKPVRAAASQKKPIKRTKKTT